MISKSYDRIRETVFSETLRNGLQIYVVPKPDFQKSYAFLAVNYGACDNAFTAEGELVRPPDGVAHFLEHKMFDTPDGDALTSLSKNGASPNAFTSASMTAYHFECTEKFYDNLGIMIDFVSHGYFSDQSVEKEQGIIAQEIRMIEDNPEWRVFNNALRALYKNHPVRISTAGTVESISEITAKTLYDCHGMFYTPSNMVLCAVGRVDPKRIAAMASDMFPSERRPSIPRDYGLEPETAALPKIEARMEVSHPIFSMAFKDGPLPLGRDNLRRRFIAELSGEALMGSSSPLYSRMYEGGLINRNYEQFYYSFSGGSCLMVNGESKRYEEVHGAIFEEAERIRRNGLDGALFERLRKTSFGSAIRGLNSHDSICHEQAACYFAGASFFEFGDIFGEIRTEDVEEYISSVIRPERSALSIVLPCHPH